MVLPFLEDDAIIVFHDTSLHTKYALKKKYPLGERAITNNLLMSSITGRKILQGNYEGSYFPNIGGIRMNKTTKENVFEIFNLLMIRWHYLPTERQEREIMSWFEKYYDKYYIDYLKKVFLYQKTVIANDNINVNDNAKVNDNIKQNKIKKIIKKILGKA